MANEDMTDEVLQNARIRVPDDVAARTFDAETVVLHLISGHYHGLNPTGGRILELLRETGSVSRTAETLAGEHDLPVEDVVSDVAEFCRSLAARQLVEIDRSDG